MARQLRRWARQLDSSRSRDLPGIDEFLASLEASVPTGGDGTIVHGDYRLDNLIVAGPAEPDAYAVRAVLDWEMATLGDPLADVGLLVAYWDGLGASDDPVVAPIGPAAGLPPGSMLVARYAERSGRDLSTLPWYVAFGFFKIAAILEGIHYRHLHGQTVGGGFDRIGDIVPGLVADGRQALSRTPTGADQRRREARLEAAHPREPRVRVGRAVGVVPGHLGVGQDEERAVLERRHRRLRDVVGFESAGVEQRAPDVAGAGEHRRPDPLRAERLDAHAAVAVRQGEPLREGERAVLGDGVRRRTGHAQQTRGGDGGEEVPAAALDPLPQEQPRGPHVPHDVDLPGPLPLLRREPRGRRRWPPRRWRSTGRSRRAPRGPGATSAVTPWSEAASPAAGQTAHLGGHPGGCGGVDVVDDDLRALGGEPAGQGGPDPRAGAGDDGSQSPPRMPCPGRVLG